MKGSFLASQIDQEYRRKEYFKNKIREKCMKDAKRKCTECKYQNICEDVE